MLVAKIVLNFFALFFGSISILFSVTNAKVGCVGSTLL